MTRHGTFVKVECDFCGNFTDVEIDPHDGRTPVLYKVNAKLVELGWRIFKGGEEYCSECVKLLEDMKDYR